MRAIVTICGGPYSILLPLWLDRLRRLTDLPVFVLLLEGTPANVSTGCRLIRVDPAGNPFPKDSPEHACAEKQRIFEHLPRDISDVLFIDIDALVLGDFWSFTGYFDMSRSALVLAPDLFIGYKEKMESEFQPFDPAFRMRYLPNGGYYYFNTGVLFASRQTHQQFLARCLQTWSSYVSTLGSHPSIFDQNIFNYCLIAFNAPVESMPIQNNCLRQYSKVIRGGAPYLDGSEVRVMHFNGGESRTKLARWLEFERAIILE